MFRPAKPGRAHDPTNKEDHVCARRRDDEAAGTAPRGTASETEGVRSPYCTAFSSSIPTISIFDVSSVGTPCRSCSSSDEL